MIERGLLEAYRVAAKRVEMAAKKGKIDERSVNQLASVVKIQAAAREILNDLGTPDISPSLGDVLKLIREQLGLKRGQVANQLGIDASTYGRYEKNSASMNDTVLHKYLEVYGENISEEDKEILLPPDH